MPSLEFFLVSERCATDQVTNKLSIFEVLEEVRSSTFPASIYSAVAITLWRADPEDINLDFQANLVLHLPDGTQHTFATNFRMTSPRHRTLQRLQGIQLNSPGELRFEMTLNGRHIADHFVTVIQMQ
jgi:hypothetical protein